MEASVVDLRYKMNDVLKALDRNEKVKVLYHGKIKGVIVPQGISARKGIKNHPFFGMLRDDGRKTQEIMRQIRRRRYDAV